MPDLWRYGFISVFCIYTPVYLLYFQMHSNPCRAFLIISGSFVCLWKDITFALKSHKFTKIFEFLCLPGKRDFFSFNIHVEERRGNIHHTHSPYYSFCLQVLHFCYRSFWMHYYAECCVFSEKSLLIYSSVFFSSHL